MDAKTPNEAAMARVKMSSQEIWELYQQAEDFNKQDAFLDLELKNAWNEYEKTKAPLEEAKKRLTTPGALNPDNPPPPLEPELDWIASICQIRGGSTSAARRRRHRMKAPDMPPRKLNEGEAPPPPPTNPVREFFENLPTRRRRKACQGRISRALCRRSSISSS